jgi:hypothetical protein
MRNFRTYHLGIIEDIAEVIKKLDDNNFVSKIEILNGSSIGQHIRHIVEFYICLFDGIEKGIVNYEDRKRDILRETMPIYTLEILEKLKIKLKLMDFGLPLKFKQTIGEDELLLNTNITREITYLAEHTIHHFALIKIGMNVFFPEIHLAKNFGVAESTIKYRNETIKCAS